MRERERMSGTNVFLQSSSVEKLHSKKGTWQRVNLKLTGKKGSRATLTYSIKTKTYEVPLWIDKTRQASSKEIMAVDGTFFFLSLPLSAHYTPTPIQVEWTDRSDGSSREETARP